MARKLIELKYDDLDGSEATETKILAVDGVLYQIDLNKQHAAELDAALSRFLVPGLAVLGRSNGNPRVFLTDDESARIVEHEEEQPAIEAAPAAAPAPVPVPTPKAVAARLGVPARPAEPEPPAEPAGKDPTVVAIEEYSKSGSGGAAEPVRAGDQPGGTVPEGAAEGDAGEPVAGDAPEEAAPAEEAAPQVKDTSSYKRTELRPVPDKKEVRAWAIRTRWTNPRTGKVMSERGSLPEQAIEDYLLYQEHMKKETKPAAKPGAEDKMTTAATTVPVRPVSSGGNTTGRAAARAALGRLVPTFKPAD